VNPIVLAALDAITSKIGKTAKTFKRDTLYVFYRMSHLSFNNLEV
jgi:hypothetical protein